MSPAEDTATFQMLHALPSATWNSGVAAASAAPVVVSNACAKMEFAVVGAAPPAPEPPAPSETGGPEYPEKMTRRPSSRAATPATKFGFVSPCRGALKAKEGLAAPLPPAPPAPLLLPPAPADPVVTPALTAGCRAVGGGSE